MYGWIPRALKAAEVQALEFMVGDFTACITLFPSETEPPARFRSVLQGFREACDQFLRVEQFADVPGQGLVSSTSLLGFNRMLQQYECFCFSSAFDAPLVLRGEWRANELVLISEPAKGQDGLQRLRHTYSVVGEDRWRFLEERWEPSGYVKRLAGVYELGAAER